MAAINVIDMFPIDGSTYVALDSKITITFDAPVDPFTVANGISIFTKSTSLWTGAELAVLDSPLSDVLTIGDEFTYSHFSFEVSDKQVTLTPLASLYPDKVYFVQVLPGEDVTRYVSLKTFGDPVYQTTSTGRLNILSSYSGDDDSYSFTFSSGASGLNVDVLKGAVYVGGFAYTDGAKLPITDIHLTLTGSFNSGDIITLDVFKSKGVSQVYKSKFTTSEYTTSAPTSKKITTLASAMPFRVLETKPSDQTINNTYCNPIVIRTDRAIKTFQDLASKIRIKKVDMETGEEKFCKFYTTTNGNVLKIYLTGFE